MSKFSVHFWQICTNVCRHDRLSFNLYHRQKHFRYKCAKNAKNAIIRPVFKRADKAQVKINIF